MNKEIHDIKIDVFGVDNFMNQLNETLYHIEFGRWGKYGEEWDEIED